MTPSLPHMSSKKKKPANMPTLSNNCPTHNNSNKKTKHLYTLTQRGIQEKTAITKQFIIKKKQEYDKLNSYLNT